jgi:hypothetical protein
MIGLFKEEDKLEIIGLSGMAGSGKDYIGTNCLTDYFKISLADHFKNDVVGKGIHSYEEVYYTKPPEVRHSLQIIGTEQGRDVYGTNVWVHCIEAWIYSIYRKNGITKFCVPDVRFDNEAEWIRDLGGLVFLVNSNRSRFGMDEQAKQHRSEAGINPSLVDGIIYNNEGTVIQDLNYQVDTLINLHRWNR